MVTVPSSEGRAAYGIHYKSIDEFCALHLNTAGARSHDKIHDGMGIVTQHLAITQAFELALQAIAPRYLKPSSFCTKNAKLLPTQRKKRSRRALRCRNIHGAHRHSA